MCTDVEIWDALNIVGAKIAISELPQKLDTVLEDAESLSRGQVNLEMDV